MRRTPRQRRVIPALMPGALALLAAGCAGRPPCAVDPHDLALVARAALAAEAALGAPPAPAPDPPDPRDCEAIARAYREWEARLEAANDALMEEQMNIVRRRARAAGPQSPSR